MHACNNYYAIGMLYCTNPCWSGLPGTDLDSTTVKALYNSRYIWIDSSIMNLVQLDPNLTVQSIHSLRHFTFACNCGDIMVSGKHYKNTDNLTSVADSYSKVHITFSNSV